MKKNEIKVGGLYAARVNGKHVTVRVDAIRDLGPMPKRFGGNNGTSRTIYDVTNLATGRTTTFRSAAKFRSEEKPKAPVDTAALAEQLCPDDRIDRSGQPAPSYPPATPPVEEYSLDEEGNEVPADAGGEQSPDPTPTAPPAPAPASTAAAAEVEECPDCTEYDDGETCGTCGRLQGGSTTPEADDVATIAHPERVADRLLLEERTSRTAPLPSAPGPGLAARIAATLPSQQFAGMTPTAEQQAILDAARAIEAARGAGQRVLVIGAGAGTGKTATLKMLEQVLSGIGQYTAFNSSLVTENKAKFHRAACNTTHSLAFRAVGRTYAHRLNGPRVRSHEIAARLGIQDFTVELPPELSPPAEDGKPTLRTLKAGFLAGQVVAGIRRFCQSADPSLGRHHLKHFAGIDAPGSYDNSDRVKDYLLPFTHAMWADKRDPKGTMPFSHDDYVKIWQLGTSSDRPVISADYILLDEAQDTAPVMLDILRRQEHALLILVGDDNQSIYEWRGAINAMAQFPDAPRRLLSQSFRFGQAVADVANAVLAELEVPTDLVMKGLPAIPTRVCSVAEPRCHLFRTNAGAVGMLMSARAGGKRGHLIGGSAEVVEFCRAAIDLQAKRGTGHPELGCFTTWGEVQEYAKTDEGQDLRLMVKLIDQFGAEEIRDALADMPAEEDADLVLSTAHRSKGREWTSVRLGPDWPTANKLDDATRRLVYVACTRAQEELDLTQCPTFCGGMDRQGGEDGGGAARSIPGIPIAYTAGMPEEADLAAYRAGKAQARPKPAMVPDGPLDPRPCPAPATAPQGNGGDNAPEYTWANLNNAWFVRGPTNKVGQTVKVYRKDGTASTVTLREVERRLGAVWMYRTR